MEGMHPPEREASNRPVTVVDSHDGRVREFRLGGSRGNLITEALVRDLRDAVRAAAADPALKLIIIAGAGEHFSYGADVGEHLPERIGDVLPMFHQLIGELLSCDVPTLARVSGYCLGGGFELALACSILWCDRTAKIGVPEISLGVFPPVAAVLLSEKVSRVVAADLILTGRTITGDEAHRIGIASHVAERADLERQLQDFIVTHVLPKSASSLRFASAALQSHLRHHFAQEIPAIEALYLDKLMHTHDAVEGARAFLEKRPPDWQDR